VVGPRGVLLFLSKASNARKRPQTSDHRILKHLVSSYIAPASPHQSLFDPMGVLILSAVSSSTASSLCTVLPAALQLLRTHANHGYVTFGELKRTASVAGLRSIMCGFLAVEVLSLSHKRLGCL